MSGRDCRDALERTFTFHDETVFLSFAANAKSIIVPGVVLAGGVSLLAGWFASFAVIVSQQLSR